jgi:hypothetical protein
MHLIVSSDQGYTGALHQHGSGTKKIDEEEEGEEEKNAASQC